MGEGRVVNFSRVLKEVLWCLVTEGGISGQAFAWLQALIPWGRKPHVMIDCNWYRPASRLRRMLQRWRVRLAARSVERFVVWASHEVADYARAFDLPCDKLEYVPFHTTLHDYQFTVRDDGYATVRRIDGEWSGMIAVCALDKLESIVNHAER